MKNMSKRILKYEDFLDDALVGNPSLATEYLNEAIKMVQEGDSIDIFLLALRDVARANGITKIANKTKKSRTSLYKSLAEKADPKFSTIMDILDSLNIYLGFHSKKNRKAA